MSAPRPAPTQPGLDIAGRYTEIRRLTFKHPQFRLAVARGHDPEDVMQTVFVGLLTRQQGASRFDPSRAGFGKYVCTVAGSVILNMLDSSRRLARHEQVGMRVGPEGVEGDASQATHVPETEPEAVGATLDEVLLERTLRGLPKPVAAVARDILGGMPAAQVCEVHGITRPAVSRIVARVDAMAKALRAQRADVEPEDEPEPVPAGIQMGFAFGAVALRTRLPTAEEMAEVLGMRALVEDMEAAA